MWNKEFANKLKEKINKSQEVAITSASGFVGKIEKVNPLKVSVLNAELIYDNEDIVRTNTFKAKQEITAEATKLKVGQNVLVLPIDGLDMIAIIDRLEGK